MRHCVKMETMLVAAERNANLYGYDPRPGTETVKLADLMSIQSQDSSTDNSAPIFELCVKMQFFNLKYPIHTQIIEPSELMSSFSFSSSCRGVDSNRDKDCFENFEI